MSALVEVTPQKPKRGRPRKTVDPNTPVSDEQKIQRLQNIDGQNPGLVGTPTPKKRGRPRKSKVPVEGGDFTPNQQLQHDQQQHGTPNAFPSVKRKRGRPPRSATAGDSILESVQQLKHVLDNHQQENGHAVINGNMHTPGRPRGRPRKIPRPDEADHVHARATQDGAVESGAYPSSEYRAGTTTPDVTMLNVVHQQPPVSTVAPPAPADGPKKRRGRPPKDPAAVPHETLQSKPTVAFAPPTGSNMKAIVIAPPDASVPLMSIHDNGTPHHDEHHPQPTYHQQHSPPQPHYTHSYVHETGHSPHIPPAQPSTQQYQFQQHYQPPQPLQIHRHQPPQREQPNNSLPRFNAVANGDGIVKRGRGRPRKADTGDAPKKAPPLIGPDGVPIKRGRGRPRKIRSS